MCGIAAAFSYHGGPADRDEIQRACDTMARRGPDGQGLWSSPDGEVVLGHRRLAIIELSERGAQPMHDGATSITYNGEIYNFKEVRAELERDGCRFETDSDTEVLLKLFARRGHDMVHALRGMFAFAIWDGRRRELFIARDPYGIKPLYVADDGRTVRVASQVRALLATEAVDTSPSPAGHAGFHLWGHVPDPHTIYRGIRSLPAGSWGVYGEGGLRSSHTFANVSNAFAEAEREGPPPDRGDVREVIREALVDSVRHHLVSDVEVGVFLSAGLDSTAMVSLAAEIGSSPRAITIAFEEYRGTDDDEAPIASEIARNVGARHEIIEITRKDFVDLEADFFSVMDQPSTDGLNTYLVSHAAAQAGLKVALSGVGGDELFAGYPSFDEVPRLAGLVGGLPIPRVVGRGFRRVSAPVMGRLTSPKYAGVIEYGGSVGGAFLLRRGMFMPWELPELLGPDMAREGWEALQTIARLEETVNGIESDYARVAALEATWYMRNQLLRDTDWASMAHGLEVRTPLVDWHLLQKLAPALVHHHDHQKADLMRAVSGAMPATARSRPKTGFTTPVRRWLHENGTVSPRDRGLRGWARHVLRTHSQS